MGNTRNDACVTMPNMPSAPMSRLLSDAPYDALDTAFVRIISPSASAASSPITCAPIEPCRAAV